LEIKKLNDRVLTQNVILQTLVDIIIDSGIISEEKLEIKIEKNIEKTQELLNSFDKETDFQENSEEVMGSMYFGPHGEA
tara:strand:+ start:612 stop:848 length:237 start_codon:yes stop_codon:yes gene_type:complete